jgi:hypothetical protein
LPEFRDGTAIGRVVIQSIALFLNNVAHDLGSGRRRRTSGEMSPAKKYRIEDEDDDYDDDSDD